jgi:hypothetical protein
MPGKQITTEQEKLYMSLRNIGESQRLSAAKSGFSERTGRNIEHNAHRGKGRHWRTRVDPLTAVWESELIPLLKSEPGLQPITLLEYLQVKYGDIYPDNLQRTLQRRVKLWRAVHGPKQDVIFRQHHPLGRQGISDFTELKAMTISINNKPYKHLLYHFRLSCSGWSHIKVIEGGESFTAFAEGLQEALWRLGGAPLEHRTDSLSAAFKNLSEHEKEDITRRYDDFCKNYNMIATRNNRGVSHENGSIESPHGHIKRRIKQALLLRGSSNFESVECYQAWMHDVVHQHNRRNAKNVDVERKHLQPLPYQKSADYTEICARVSTSSTIEVRRGIYSVPSRLKGECLRVHLYHNRLECYLGATQVISLARVRLKRTERGRNIDYRHLIHSLAKKPQAFRFSALRDDILPNDTYKQIWKYAESTIRGKSACKFMVGLLLLAAENDCETVLGCRVIAQINQGGTPSLTKLQYQFGRKPAQLPTHRVNQHQLSSYDDFLSQEVSHGSC